MNGSVALSQHKRRCKAGSRQPLVTGDQVEHRGVATTEFCRNKPSQHASVAQLSELVGRPGIGVVESDRVLAELFQQTIEVGSPDNGVLGKLRINQAGYLLTKRLRVGGKVGRAWHFGITRVKQEAFP